MRRTNAQKFALVVGLTLVLAGLAGFLAEASFDDGEPVQGSLLLGLEVNGWHNIVHIASGLLLLASAGRPRSSRFALLAFGFVYLFVAIAGFGSQEILDVVPVNGADNWLHMALAVLALLFAFRSRRPDRRESALHPSSWGVSRPAA
jgi:purine-cytosine permease-like protein